MKRQIRQKQYQNKKEKINEDKKTKYALTPEDQIRSINEKKRVQRAPIGDAERLIINAKRRLNYASLPAEKHDEILQKRSLRSSMFTKIEHDVNNIIQKTKINVLKGSVEYFKMSINIRLEFECKICLKRMYGFQVYVLKISDMAKKFMPPELADKNKIAACSRCNHHFKKPNVASFISIAFWNNMLPGEILQVVKNLGSNR